MKNTSEDIVYLVEAFTQLARKISLYMNVQLKRGNNMHKHHLEVVRAVLEEDGWSFDRILPSATLPIHTAAGGRAAVANMVIPGTIHWEYVSEGQNVLSTHTTYISSDASEAEVRRVLTDALVHVHHAIDNSYARRLYLKYPVTAEQVERRTVLEALRAKVVLGKRLIMIDEAYVWFVRSDDEVRWMKVLRADTTPEVLHWVARLGTLPLSVLTKAEVIELDDPRIDEYEVRCPGIGAWFR